MLRLRVARRSRPAAVSRGLLLAAVSGGAGFLLLCALGCALAGPRGTAAARLLWCSVPVAAALPLAAAVSRVRASRALREALAAVGGEGRGLAGAAAAATGLACAAGSGLALPVFLHVRGDLAGWPTGGWPLSGALSSALGAGLPLPVAGTLTLLAVVPLLGAAVSALAVRPSPARPPRVRRARRVGWRVGPRPGALTAADRGPWGTLRVGGALLLGGLGVELCGAQLAPGYELLLPGGLDPVPAVLLAGWVVAVAGLVLAGPGLVHLCGRLLASARPGAVRLLAGRGLQSEAGRLGRPLGLLCAAGCGAVAAVRLAEVSAQPRPGPLTACGAALVVLCAVGTVLAAAAESRRTCRPARVALSCLGAPASVSRRAAVLRTGALLAWLGPLTWLAAELVAFPVYW
ncbi:hypothetical protein GCM10027168_68620 [Streptomyces capparidis]